jgi:hypothetical protein
VILLLCRFNAVICTSSTRINFALINTSHIINTSTHQHTNTATQVHNVITNTTTHHQHNHPFIINLSRRSSSNITLVSTPTHHSRSAHVFSVVGDELKPDWKIIFDVLTVASTQVV